MKRYTNGGLALGQSSSQAQSPQASKQQAWEAARRDACPTLHSSAPGSHKHVYRHHYPDDPRDPHIQCPRTPRLAIPPHMMQISRGASPAWSDDGYSTTRTMSRSSDYNGWPETEPEGEDESTSPNVDGPSFPWDFPVSKLILAPEVLGKNKCGREISFVDCDCPIEPRGLVEIDRWGASEGGNATTRKGNLITWDNQSIFVAFKMIKVNPDVDLSKLRQRLTREVNVWCKLKHPNILPFLGVYDIGHDLPVLISPYYKSGHIKSYLKHHPYPVHRPKLVRDVAFGMKYLHHCGVVHGDLKPENILIDQHGVACICDFGISRISNIKGFTTSNRAGTRVYMAPELFEDQPGLSERPGPRTTFESDVWAFGLVSLGILTQFPLLTPVAALSPFVLVPRGDLENLLRPSQGQYGSVPLEMWRVLERCWISDPELRPTIATVLEEMEGEAVVYPRGTAREPRELSRSYDRSNRL